MARKLTKKQAAWRAKYQKAQKALKLAQRTLKQEVEAFRLHTPDTATIERRAAFDLDVPDFHDVDYAGDWHDLADNADELASDLRDLANMARTVSEAIEAVTICEDAIMKLDGEGVALC